jgi:membrane-associated protease RseP (regulator of RpoE activity)
MIGPYRIPGPVPPEPPSRCDDRPPPPACAASVTTRRLPLAFVKALSVAATVLLLTASASISAIAFSVIRALADRGRIERQAELASARHLGPDPLGALARDTHDVDTLWRQAQALASSGADVTLSRASLPAPAAAAWADGASVRVLYDAHAGGLRVVDLGERSPATLAGVQEGDVITAVNGYRLAAPEDASRAFATARDAHAVVAEVWRQGRRVVLRVDVRG